MAGDLHCAAAELVDGVVFEGVGGVCETESRGAVPVCDTVIRKYVCVIRQTRERET